MGCHPERMNRMYTGNKGSGIPDVVFPLLIVTIYSGGLGESLNLSLEVIEDDYSCVHVLDDTEALEAVSRGNLTNMRKYEMMLMAVERRTSH